MRLANHRRIHTIPDPFSTLRGRQRHCFALILG